MPTVRFLALEETMGRKPQHFEAPGTRVSEYFGSRVFNRKAMREYMTSEAYKAVIDAMDNGTKINRNIADQVAAGMKAWALNLGATHYTHWFQPLTGATAEKHDSFFEPTGNGEAIEKFSGGMLVQQEPDASSFPNGGIRNTFEARGYTAWDPTSPAFVFGSTLCIPTVFVSYTGEALDYKTPLLRALQAVDTAATAVCKYFDKNVTKVNATLGWEQEYFLVDEAYFAARPDLQLAGRALVGHAPAKGQQLDDHYFGSIPERVYAYMRDLETECHQLGIPVRTRHNEVGPGQYELAPMFEEVNLAVDHNQLLMDLMDRVAKRHHLSVLLHEKPFAGVNGSGKHNNWSMSTNTGVNLLSPGKQPGKNLLFLTFFVNTIQAVYRYADILRASVASASNDHRLGANEAPPAIISVFIGDTLTKVLDNIEKGIEADEAGVKEVLDLLSKIPNLELDNTDRNRTSPFAFTGNKFEIRMVGSSMNCAAPMTVMNTIVGKQLRDFKVELDEMMGKGMDQDSAILAILKRYITESKPIRFEGDGYSEEWKNEAAKRGLGNTPNTPDALMAYVTDSAVDLFTSSGVFTERELDAHFEVMCENYVLKLQIESRTLGEMVINHVLPAAIGYQSQLADNALQLKELGLSPDLYEAQVDLIKRISGNIIGIKDHVDKMTQARKDANAKDEAIEVAKSYCNEVKPLMETIRMHADRLEYLVDDKEWPLVKYREMMFVR
jgi:glutamine synthetase